MASPALLDTCVLFPQYLTDTLLTQASAGTFRPLRSRGILDEPGRALERDTSMNREQIRQRLDRMRAAFPDAEVIGYEGVVDGMTCDPKDRHVLAAAVRANAEVLVTADVKALPEHSNRSFDLGVVSPDDFLLDQLDIYPTLVLHCLGEQVDRYVSMHGPATVLELCTTLDRAGVPRFAAEVRRHVRRR